MRAIKPSTNFVGGVAICFIGALCFSTKAILVKLAYRDTAVDAITLLALRMIFALPFFIISAIAHSNRQENIRFTGKQWLAVAGVGCLGYYISSLLDFLGLQYISAGIERLVLFIYPTLVLLMSAQIFKVRISKIQWIAVLITYAGLVLAFVSEANFQEPQHKQFYLGSVLIFLCAFTYAAYIVGSGSLIPKLGAAKFNSYAMSFAAIGVLLHFAITGEQSLGNLSPSVYAYGFLMAVVSTVIPSFLIAEGIRRVGPGNAAIISGMGPIATIFQANILLYEPVSAMQIGGTVMILFGVLLIGWKQRSGPQTGTQSV